MHEALFDDRFLKGTGVTTLDFAKAMIDEGFHPMTMYFPLVVHGAMLIEPTETESKQSLDASSASCEAWPSAPDPAMPNTSSAPHGHSAPSPGRDARCPQAGAALGAGSAPS